MAVERYCAPESVAEAVALLASGAAPAALAGGTDLLVQMRASARQPETLVDLKRIPGLAGVEVSAGRVRIGAATPCCELSVHAGLRAGWPGLVEALGLIGSTQVQGRASLGGNLCNASPAADSVPALVACRAVAVIEGPAGTRRVAVEDFTRGPGKTVLEQGEFLHAIELPTPPARSADAYLRFIPRTEMDIAVVGVGVAVTRDADGVCTEARIALGAVAPTVLLVPEAAQALVGTTFDDAAVQSCMRIAREAARPISDRRGTAEFRRHVVGVLLQRALLVAAARATG